MKLTFKAKDTLDGVEHTYTISTQDDHSNVGNDLPCIRDEKGEYPYRRQKSIIRAKFGRQPETGKEFTTHEYIRWLTEKLSK